MSISTRYSNNTNANIARERERALSHANVDHASLEAQRLAGATALEATHRRAQRSADIDRRLRLLAIEREIRMFVLLETIAQQDAQRLDRMQSWRYASESVNQCAFCNNDATVKQQFDNELLLVCGTCADVLTDVPHGVLVGASESVDHEDTTTLAKRYGWIKTAPGTWTQARDVTKSESIDPLNCGCGVNGPCALPEHQPDYI